LPLPEASVDSLDAGRDAASSDAGTDAAGHDARAELISSFEPSGICASLCGTLEEACGADESCLPNCETAEFDAERSDKTPALKGYAACCEALSFPDACGSLTGLEVCLEGGCPTPALVGLPQP